MRATSGQRSRTCASSFAPVVPGMRWSETTTLDRLGREQRERLGGRAGGEDADRLGAEQPRERLQDVHFVVDEEHPGFLDRKRSVNQRSLALQAPCRRRARGARPRRRALRVRGASRDRLPRSCSRVAAGKRFPRAGPSCAALLRSCALAHARSARERTRQRARDTARWRGADRAATDAVASRCRSRTRDVSALGLARGRRDRARRSRRGARRDRGSTASDRRSGRTVPSRPRRPGWRDARPSGRPRRARRP